MRSRYMIKFVVV